MPRRPSQLNREIDEALLRQKGERSYGKARALARDNADAADARLGPEAAHLAAVRASDHLGGQRAFAQGWLDAKENDLRQREQYRQTRAPNEAILRRQGATAYLAAHAHIGNSTDARLGASGARRAAEKVSPRPDDQEAFIQGWRAERERHDLERSRYGGLPYVPLTLPELPLLDDDCVSPASSSDSRLPRGPNGP